MQQYHNLIESVFAYGNATTTPDGLTKTFGYSMEFDLTEGFPLTTTNPPDMDIVYRSIQRHIRTKDGWQDSIRWREWDDGLGGNIDQMNSIIHSIKRNENPTSQILCSWDVGTHLHFKDGPAAPSIVLVQFYPFKDKDGVDAISMSTYTRQVRLESIHYHIAFHAVLLHVMALRTGRVPSKLIMHGGELAAAESSAKEFRDIASRDPEESPELRIKDHFYGLEDFTTGSVYLVYNDVEEHTPVKFISDL